MVTAGDGIVILTGEDESRGIHVVIQHGASYQTWYTHLHRFIVKEGDKVKAGSEIGQVGSTGYSTGPHLHYEVKKDGVRVNPLDYIE